MSKKRKIFETFVPEAFKEKEEPKKSVFLKETRAWLKDNMVKSILSQAEERIKGHRKYMLDLISKEATEETHNFVAKWIDKNEEELKNTFADKPTVAEVLADDVAQEKWFEDLTKEEYEEEARKTMNLKALEEELNEDVISPEARSLMLNKLNKKDEELKKELEAATDPSEKDKIKEERQKLLGAREALYTLVKGEEKDFFEKKVDEDKLFSQFEEKKEKINQHQDIRKKTEKLIEAQVEFFADKFGLDLEKDASGDITGVEFSDGELIKITDKEKLGEKMDKEVETNMDKLDEADFNELINMYASEVGYEVERDSDGDIIKIEDPEGKDLMEMLEEKKGSSFLGPTLVKKHKIRATAKYLEMTLDEMADYHHKNYSGKEIEDLQVAKEIKKILPDSIDFKKITEDNLSNDDKKKIKEILKNEKINEMLSGEKEEAKEDVENKYRHLRNKMIDNVFAKKYGGGEKEKRIKQVAERYESKSDHLVRTGEVFRKIGEVYNEIVRKDKTKARTLRKKIGYGNRKLRTLFEEFDIGLTGKEIKHFTRKVKKKQEVKDALKDQASFVKFVTEMISYFAGKAEEYYKERTK
ncbi:MAG: hypothetical protein GF370_04005 [Candidatus Nealsonbacteria bacterium]|nr:hypothetical protein [Candidatus Nealsonbacteria bacterium]